jgi:hypothetical protein
MNRTAVASELVRLAKELEAVSPDVTVLNQLDLALNAARAANANARKTSFGRSLRTKLQQAEDLLGQAFSEAQQGV